MAYTQTPGRGNKPKTGDGLPTSLNSGSVNSTDPFPSPSTYAKDSDKMTFDETKYNKTIYNPKSSKFVSEPTGGVSYNQKTGEYGSKPVVSKFQKADTNKGISTGDTEMYVNKKSIGKVPKDTGKDKETYRAFVSDSLDVTAGRRIAVAEYNQKSKNLPKPNKGFYDAANKYNADIKAKTMAKKEKEGTVSSNSTNFFSDARGQEMRKKIRENVK